MKKCKKCEKEFEPQKGLINYCSLACRNSRTWSEETILKKSNSAKKSTKVKIANSKRSKANSTFWDDIKQIRNNTLKLIPEEIWLEIKKKRLETRKLKILSADYNTLKFETLKDRIVYEQNCKCNKCGLDKWLDGNIPLEIEHKDGNHFNNDRANLEVLCPNCHALTPTYRGRNKYSNKFKVSDEKLLECLLINDWNMRQSLLQLNLAEGGNYNRCHRLKKEYYELKST